MKSILHLPRRATIFAAVLFSSLLTTAHAQADTSVTKTAPAEATSPDPNADELVRLNSFVVTGIRRGIEGAIEIKSESTSIVESISSEDIGKLPDVSIAESLSRLPGLAAQRVAGRAQVISVRGLSPDFATTLLNGREQVSTGDNRSVEFDQYPSELISSVTIYKTPDAALVGQGLSGTIDMHTVRPLAYGHRTLAVNARGEWNSLTNLGSNTKTSGNRISATYIDQFANKTVGVAIGYAHLESPIAAQQFGTYGWNTNTRPGIPAGTSETDGDKVFVATGKNTRDGVIGVVEWKPTSQFTSVLDAYYSKFIMVETDRGLETNLGDFNGGNTPGLQYTSPAIVDNSLLAGTASGLWPLVRNIYDKKVDKLTAVGWNSKYHLDNWTIVGDISYSKAERQELNLETQAQYVNAAGQAVLDTSKFNFATGTFPTASYGLDYTDSARVQIGPSIYGAGYGKVPSVKDEMTSYKVEGTYALNKIFSGVDFGFNFGDRTKNKRQPEASLSASNFQPISGDVLYAPTNLGYAGTSSVLSWDVPKVLAKYYATFAPSDNAFAYLIQKTWKVEEKISTGYAKLDLNTELGSLKLKGNIGADIKYTDQSSTSNFFDDTAPAGGQAKVNRDGKKYTDVLPSLNLALELPHKQTVRVGAAKQVARPRLDQLKSAFEFDIGRTTGLPSGSGGNPRLSPWRANALDLSYEKYFGTKGYVAVAGFYKDLKTYIFDQTDLNYDFSRFTAGNPLASTNFGKFSHPLNGTGGSLKGVEFSVSVPFNLLSQFLDGFGVVASLSETNSSITVDNTNLGSAITLPGLSKTVSNITVYYEKFGFSTRISQRQRSDFIGEITGFGADRELRFVKGEKIVDFQIGYEFRTGVVKGLGVLLQINNLSNEAYQTYQKTKNQLVEYQKYGRTTLAGASYKF